jgi:hypothetical protein
MAPRHWPKPRRSRHQGPAAAKTEFCREYVGGKNHRAVPRWLASCGYVRVRNGTQDGQWSIGRRRQAVYARQELPLCDQIAAAEKLVREAPPGPWAKLSSKRP